MITGFNTNVRHGGRVFHVQTEDSGRAHPHLITHVYFGGTILATEKTSYADRLAEDDLQRSVRGLMEAQHKRMLAKLARGELDAVIAERLDGATGARVHTRSDAPAAAAPGPAPRLESSRNASTEPRIVASSPSPPAPPAEAVSTRRAFGGRTVSEKSLDALILDYLVDKARASRKNG
jgi:hypothetical protein